MYIVARLTGAVGNSDSRSLQQWCREKHFRMHNILKWVWYNSTAHTLTDHFIRNTINTYDMYYYRSFFSCVPKGGYLFIERASSQIDLRNTALRECFRINSDLKNLWPIQCTLFDLLHLMQAATGGRRIKRRLGGQGNWDVAGLRSPVGIFLHSVSSLS